MTKEEKKLINQEADNLVKRLQQGRKEISILACRKFLIKQGFNIIIKHT